MKESVRRPGRETGPSRDGGSVLSGVLFADMDGTLLDKETYEPGPAMAALVACRDRCVPVVLNSSKTRAEMEVYAKRLPILSGTPFISENGGGIFFPSAQWKRPPAAEKRGDFWCVSLGAGHRQILDVLTASAKKLGLPIRSFSGMEPEEIARRTGLSLEQARRAARREFDEPFWVEREDAAASEALGSLISEHGMKLTRGGRCHHVHGDADKGKAARYVRDRYREVRAGLPSAGVGDAANDLSLLGSVDVLYVVRQGDGSYDPEIPTDAGIRFVEGIGPLGFAEAVYDFLESRVRL